MTLASPFVFDWIHEHAQARPEAAAILTPTEALSYRQLDERVRALSAHLIERGVQAEAAVVIALPNLPATVVASLAVQAIGAVAVEVNREAGPAALSAILEETEARHAIVWGRDLAAWAGLAAHHQLVHLEVVAPASPAQLLALLGGISHARLSEGGALAVDAGSFTPTVRRRNGIASIVYTSGSTGRPRGVIQTHRNIEANTRSIAEYLELGPGDRALSILPLFYCFGKSVVQTHLFAGGSVFFDHRFSFPRVVLEALAQQRCTGFYGVPLTFELIKRQADPGALELSALRYVAQAGGAMHPETTRWVRAAFAPASLFVMYGQTEATARLSFLPPARAADKEGSIGRGIPGVTLKIADETGAELPVGAVGEVWACGENITPGYFRDPGASAQILCDGWLRTGDLGHRDADGFIFLTGRAKQILKIGGHRVSPLEIEQALAGHPDVLETAVVGVGDPLGGEAAAAFVVLRAGASLTEPALRAYCRSVMPAWKVPKGVVFVPELPRTGAGKVATSVLREMIARAGPEAEVSRPG
jgi:long-chain acyl-CoA synthetase